MPRSRDRSGLEDPRDGLILGLHKQRFGIAVTAGVGMVASFLPWIHGPFVGSATGIAGADGWITMGLFLPALTIALLAYPTHELGRTALVGAVSPALLAAAIGVFKIMHIMDMGTDAQTDPRFVQTIAIRFQPGIGLFVLAAAGFGMAFVAFMLAGSTPQPSESE